MNTFRVSLCIAIAVAFVAVNAQDHFQCTDRDCGTQCKGAECAKECQGFNCGRMCGGAECAKECQGHLCGTQCKGAECAKECTGSYCGMRCEGEECAKECTGPFCGIACTGEYCACECTGPECGGDCEGKSCGPDNCCKGREKNAEGVCTTTTTTTLAACAAGHYRAAAGAECTVVNPAGYCGPNTAYSEPSGKCTVVKEGSEYCGLNTEFSDGMCTVLTTACAAGKYRAAAGAECTVVKQGSDYCGLNTAYSGAVYGCTVIRPPGFMYCGPNTVFSGGVCVRSTPSVFGYPWACKTTIPCFFEFQGRCWIKENRPAYYSTTCAKPAGAGGLSAGADDGDGRGGMVLTEDLTDTARAQISAGCTLFSESGGQVLPEWAAQVNGSVTLIQSICAELDANGPGDFQLSGAAAAAAAPTAADLETTIANQRVGLAVVSTLLAVAIVHALYSAIVAPRGPRSSTPTLASEEPARAGRQRNSSASAASFSAGKGRTGSEFSISEI